MRSLYKAGIGAEPVEPSYPVSNMNPYAPPRTGMRWVSPETIIVAFGGLLAGRLLERILK